MSADLEFRVRTAAELARLTAKASAARRYVAHRPCSDDAPCRHCAAIRDVHAHIDDHLDQLELAALEGALQEPAAKRRKVAW